MRSRRRLFARGSAVLAVWAILVGGLASAPAAVAAEPAASATALLAGKITDAKGAPLAGVGVSATSDEVWETTETDRTGAWSMSGLGAGDYRLLLEAPSGANLVSTWWKNAVDRDGATVVRVKAGEKITSLNASLAKGSIISGRVTDQKGAGVGGVLVEYSPLSQMDRRFSVETSADGTYRFVGLRKGSYAVQFFPLEPKNLLGEWWRDAATRSTAKAVTVGSGVTVSRIDASLAPGGILSGTVRDDRGRALPDAMVQVQNVDTGRSYRQSSVGAGAWRIPSLPPGTYRVNFSAPYGVNLSSQWWKSTSTAQKGATVTVAAGKTVGKIDARLTRGGTIGGVVTAPSGAPAADVEVAVYLDGEALEHTYTTSNGSYRLEGLADGKYTVRFRATDGNFATTWWKGQTSSISATPVTISKGNDLRRIDGRLTSGAKLTGTLRDASGAGFAHATVDAYRYVGGTWEWASYADTDLKGRYALAGLPAGTYALQFSTWHGQKRQSIWWGGKHTRADAKRLTVRASAVLSGFNAVLPEPPVAGTVEISGTVRVGSTLTAVTRSWARGSSMAYQWYRAGEPIEGATRPTLLLTPGDFGRSIRVVVSGWSKVTSSIDVDRETDGPVGAGKLAASVPKVSGTAKVGSTLKASPGAWTKGASLSYQWSAGGKAISKATAVTYKIPAALRGKKITVTVTGVKDGYLTASRTSAATKAVAR